MTNKDSFNGGTNIGVGNTAGGDIYAAGRDVYIQKKMKNQLLSMKQR